MNCLTWQWNILQQETTISKLLNITRSKLEYEKYTLTVSLSSCDWSCDSQIQYSGIVSGRKHKNLVLEWVSPKMYPINGIQSMHPNKNKNKLVVSGMYPCVRRTQYLPVYLTIFEVLVLHSSSISWATKQNIHSPKYKKENERTWPFHNNYLAN